MASSDLSARSARSTPRTRPELLACYEQPLPELLYRAATVHRAHHDPRAVQLSTLANIKQGGCPEDCGYCPQAARYHTGVDATPLLDVGVVRAQARAARDAGSTRFCMGAAWRDVPEDERFAQVCDLVREVAALGLEVCCTLGMLTARQATALRDAGCHFYNHNLDTSPEFYGSVITTRTYQDRLETLARVRAAGLRVCCGGILGMGETRADRVGLLAELVALDPPPESVPINCLVRVTGTPLADQGPVEPLEMVRMVATTRIALPQAQVRLSAGRREMSPELQALCFVAGANSIFTGERLLTTPNPGQDEDLALLQTLGMYPAAAGAPTQAGAGR